MDTFYHAVQLPLFIEHISEDCTCKGKFCSKCKYPRCLKTFCRDSSKKDKLRPDCAVCRSLQKKTYQQANKKKTSERGKAYYAKNREAKLTRMKSPKSDSDIKHAKEKKIQISFVNTHTKEVKKAEKTRKQAEEKEIKARKIDHLDITCACIGKRCIDCNKVLCCIAFRKYTDNRTNTTRVKSTCMTCELAQATAYSKEEGNREGILVRRKVHGSKRRAHKRNASGSYTGSEWLVLKHKYNNTCLRCKRKEPEIKLTADHVIPLAKHGANSIDNIQPLCASCNARKHTNTTDYRILYQEERNID
jgi:5-methylcytosine-specific restriction endonuclease McrA